MHRRHRATYGGTPTAGPDRSLIRGVLFYTACTDCAAQMHLSAVPVCSTDRNSSMKLLPQFALNAIRLMTMLPMAAGGVLTYAQARAVTVPDLYDVTLPVEGSRDTAFVEALKVIAVRVSGQRDAGTRLGASTNNPRQYVQRFGVTGDNQLQVGFDGTAIDRLLGDVGLPIWGRERPATLVLLSVETGDGAAHWIDSRTATAERDIVGKAATMRGLPLIWPDAIPDLSAGTATADLMRLAANYNANATLVGRARRAADGAYSVRWTLASEAGGSDASGSLEDGVHLAADTFARAYSASGTSLDSVLVEVSGIADLNAYGTTLNYLEGMTLVRSVAVESVTGDMVRFRLAVRGDAPTFKRALALDHRLVPQLSESTAADRLQLRYQP